jgi:vacuolar-type H+-ATPase subunit I/STV1
VSNTIKEIVELLHSDGLIHAEKVGTSMYYFRFPNQVDLPLRIKELQEQLQVAKEKNEKLVKEIAKEESFRPESDERKDQLQKLEQVTRQVEQLNAQREEQKELLRMVKISKGIQISKEASNRWTDSIFTIEMYLKNKFGMDSSQIRKEFRIPDELDYIA